MSLMVDSCTRLITKQCSSRHSSNYTIADKDNKKSGGNDVYTLELYSIRVLKKPLPAVVSPHKRKVSTKDPMESGSPTKRSKPTN
jgi:hypothetical protein